MIAHIGYPGGRNHRAVYVTTRKEAHAWFARQQAAAAERGDKSDYLDCGLNRGVLSNRDAWTVRYRDGRRVYASVLTQAAASILGCKINFDANTGRVHVPRDAGLMRRTAQESATFTARVEEQEAARQEYIRLLRDVARAIESDPSAFHGAALQVRDTSAVVVEAFEAGPGRGGF